MPKVPPANAEQVAVALSRFERRFRKTLAALDRLYELGLIDHERYHHIRLLLEHSRARVGLDAAEWAQQSELAECSRLDRRLRKLESKISAE